MPCYDPETHDRPIRLEARIHKLTEMLCQLCTIVDMIDPKIIPFNPTLNDWWIKHKEFDQISKELIKKVEEQGINNLTNSERSHYYRSKNNNALNP